MVLKRPDEGNPILPDVDLVDELVRKSLEINKHLKAGDSTGRYLESLRESVRQKVPGAEDKSGKVELKKGAAPPKAPEKMVDRKARTFVDFLKLKSDEFQNRHQQLREKRKELEREEAELRNQTAHAISDMLMVVADGEDVAPFRAALTDESAFLSLLGVRDVDLLKGIKKRK
jgi:hypothetical protein